MLKIFLLSFFLAFFLISANTNAYEISYIARDFVEVPNANASAPSVFWSEDCTTSMILYATATNIGSYSLIHSYFSPDFAFIATNPKSRDNNITCQIQNSEAISSSNSVNDFYEATTRTEYSSSTIDTWLNISYDCSPDSNDLFIYNDTRKVDSYGNHPFGYGDAFTTCFAQSPAQCPNTLTSDLNSVMQYVTDGYFTLCGSDIRQDAEGEAFGGNSAGVQSDLSMNYWTMIPFNSESTGVVNISVLARVFYFSGVGNCGSGQQKDSQFYLWDIVENTTQNLGTGFPLDFNSNLIPNRDYWLLIGSRYYCDDFNFGVLQINHNYTQYSITLNACETDFVCGNFSVCTDGVQTRTCIDQSVCNAPTRIEEQSCFDVPSETIDLGFEEIVDLIPQFIYTCQKDWTLVSCVDVLATITARFPVNWTISADLDRPGGAFRQNYIRVSDDTSTIGTRSLQMNYIPPKLSEPVADPGNASLTICGNKTSGDFPFVTTGLNQSIFVARNISFPSPFIQLRLDARKCSEPILQYDYTSGIYSLCDIAGIQRKLCYSTNCSAEPRGNYRVGVFDAQTLEQIVEFTDTAINSWTSHIIDLSNAGLLVNHNYTIILVVNPEVETGVFDPNSHCVYFDNFRVTITEVALPECITRCEGFNLLLANEFDNICFFTEITNSPACAPDQSTAESFQNFETVCIGTTLNFFNNETGLWDQTTNSDLCIEEEAAITDAENITTPLATTAEYIEFFDFIISPIFIYMIFAMIISGILSATIARITKNGDGVFQVFGVSMIIFLLLGSLPGIAVIPIWISIAVIAVISLLIAQKLRGFGFPGGGG